MAEVKPYIAGLFTWSPAAIQELHDIKYGRKEAREQRDILQKDAERLIALQQSLSFPFISDGQLLWRDNFRPTYADIDGVVEGKQLRYPRTNGFCFPARIDGMLATKNASLEQYYYTVPHNRSLRIIGPYTFASTAENCTQQLFDDIITVYADHVVHLLKSTDISLLELAEPAVFGVVAPFSVQKAYRKICAATRAFTVLHTGNIDANTLDSSWGSLTDIFHINLLETKNSPAWLQKKSLAFGVLDARNAEPEDIEYCAQQVRKHCKKLNPPSIFVTTNDQLFYTIGYTPAVQKVKSLALLRDKLTEVNL